jgi:hypothetical protein
MAFSLSGETVPQAGTPGEPNCHGKSIAAMARQFGGSYVGAVTLGFSSEQALQDAFQLFCQP